jgi:small conductance mechanosensitive channel
MSVSGPLQDLLAKIISFLPGIIAAVVIFVATLVLSALAARWTRRVTMARTGDKQVARLLAGLARWSVLSLGTIVALGQVDFNITGFIAGLGIAGVTIGVALQDITRNFVAGVLIVFRKPFSIGDAVQIGNYSGSVRQVTTRDTAITTWDGQVVIVPNLMVFSNPIVNYTMENVHRRTLQIGLGYAEDIKHALGVFQQAITRVDGVLDDPVPTVRAEQLGNSTIGLVAQFWVNQTTHDQFEVHSNVVQAIKQASQTESIDLPYPIQTVQIAGSLPQGSQMEGRVEAAEAGDKNN